MKDKDYSVPSAPGRALASAALLMGLGAGFTGSFVNEAEASPCNWTWYGCDGGPLTLCGSNGECRSVNCVTHTAYCQPC